MGDLKYKFILSWNSFVIDTLHRIRFKYTLRILIIDNPEFFLNSIYLIFHLLDFLLRSRFLMRGLK